MFPFTKIIFYVNFCSSIAVVCTALYVHYFLVWDTLSVYYMLISYVNYAVQCFIVHMWHMTAHVMVVISPLQMCDFWKSNSFLPAEPPFQSVF